MSPRPKPLVGALLGLLLGVIVVMLLWILGVTPPDRLPLFSVLAVAMLLGASATTLAVRHAPARYGTVVVIAAVGLGVALTGIPEYTGTGSLSEGCHAQATSSLETEPVAPADTSALRPFDVTQDDTVTWSASTDAEARERDAQRCPHDRRVRDPSVERSGCLRRDPGTQRRGLRGGARERGPRVRRHHADRYLSLRRLSRRRHREPVPPWRTCALPMPAPSADCCRFSCGCCWGWWSSASASCPGRWLAR
ncbi:hypothetical protein [Demequina litorisediminis]|uniref:hypothetical protein n=1 Tax=Demequina litorisediminis TaxID=1849022 RepID=UPI0024E0B5C5|nr:hypothetical protein [Demequina litorisediminis]